MRQRLRQLIAAIWSFSRATFCLCFIFIFLRRQRKLKTKYLLSGNEAPLDWLDYITSLDAYLDLLSYFFT